jgi:hypothetical protein
MLSRVPVPAAVTALPSEWSAKGFSAMRTGSRVRQGVDGLAVMSDPRLDAPQIGGAEAAKLGNGLYLAASLKQLKKRRALRLG